MSEPDPFASFEIASLSGTESADGTEQSEVDSDGAAGPVVNESSNRRIKLKQYGSDNRNFYDENGYIYSQSNNVASNKSLYLRCKNKEKFDCNVRAIAQNKDLNNTMLKGEHTHFGRRADVNQMKFCYKLDKNIRANPLEFGREVYLQTMEAMVDTINVDDCPDKKELSSFIYRRKRKFLPKLPKTVADFEEMLTDERYNQRFTKDKRKNTFYRGAWKSEKGGSNFAFISETILRIVLLMSSISIRMDGTFKMLPRHMNFRQLFIISVTYRDKSYPLAYILMEKKNFEAYDNVFSKLKEFIPGHLVTEIMSDYETATRKAAVKHFPKARIIGCWFHYVQAINRVAKRFGLWSDDKFSDSIKYISALALLPHNYIVNGFEHIGKRRKLFLLL